jgi:hypothetical protein
MKKPKETTTTKLVKALDKIGVSNGSKAPDSQDPMDKLLHEYSVAATGATYFDKRKKRAREDIENAFDTLTRDNVSALKNEVITNGVAQRTTLVHASVYQLNTTIRGSGRMIDDKLMRVALLKRMNMDEVEKVMAEGSRDKAPTVIFEVMETDQ